MTQQTGPSAFPPLPAGEAASADFRVSVGGQPLAVYTCRVSAAPLNQPWPGHQRPLDQTELASFAYFETGGPCAVQVEYLAGPVHTAQVKPAVLGIRPVMDGSTLHFTLDGPGQCTVEVNGTHRALHLFADPPEVDTPDTDDENTLFFGPGVHHAGNINLRSGQTVYIAAGAVVYGSIYAHGVRDIRILGRGVLDGSGNDRPILDQFEQVDKDTHCGCIFLSGCQNVRIEGIICRDPNLYAITPSFCRGLLIENVKLVGLWRYNTDGIDICNSQDVTIRRCFLRTFDDAIVIKGYEWCCRAAGFGPPSNVDGVLVEDCTIWCDWGKALEVGVETRAREMKNITMRRCRIIRTCFASIDVYCANGAAVSNLLFKDIDAENDPHTPRFVFQSSEGEVYVDDPADDYVPSLISCVIADWVGDMGGGRGTLENLVFRNIRSHSRLQPPVAALGYGPQNRIRKVRFQNITWNGQRLDTPQKLGLQINEFVEDIRVE